MDYGSLEKQIIEEEYNLAKWRISIRIQRLRDGNGSSALKLEFRNKISETILTGDKIEGDGHTMIEVALVDDTAGKIVDFGPEASARVEILVLKGEFDHSEGVDWTVEEFNENIVPEIQGKMPFLAGNVLLKLQRGTCALENIKFRHHTSKRKPPVFRLGARVVETYQGVRIKEAKTDSFTVKDFRNKYYKKHEFPAMSDDVWRLSNIRKGGEIHKRLRAANIYTVLDFLIQLHLDFDGLKRIVNLGTMKWEKTVIHARECPSRHNETGTFQIIGESSNRETNFSSQVIISNVNIPREVIYESPPPMQFDSDHSSFNSDAFIEEMLNEPAGEQQIGETGILFVEESDISKAPKRWRKLYYVSRWFLIRKMKSNIQGGTNHISKKRKVA